MRRLRRGVTLGGLLTLALLPVVATAVSTEAPSRAPVPVAIAQSIAVVSAPLLPVRPSARFSETGLLVLVGTGLMGLAALVRKTTAPRDDTR